jgi:hypothetical protein
VHEVALAAMAAWCAAFVPGVSSRLRALRALGGPVGTGLASASWLLLADSIGAGDDILPVLASRRFRASVEWRSSDLRPSAPAKPSRAARRASAARRGEGRWS